MKVAAVLIVKNEEEMLERCLKSVAPMVDGIFILDTGSTDGTMEIAKRYATVLEQENMVPFSFGDARNKAMALVPQEYDFIFSIDADEEAVWGVSKKDFYEWLESLEDKYHGIVVPLEDIQHGRKSMNMNALRMFRNGKVVWRNRVHNQPIVEGETVIFTYVTLRHYGYALSPEKMEAKHIRTRDLLMEQLKHPEENRHTEFYLSQLYGTKGMTNECLEWGYKYFQKKEELGKEFHRSCLYTMAREHIKLFEQSGDQGQLQNALKLAQVVFAETHNDPDMATVLSDCGSYMRNNAMMVDGARRFVAGYDEFTANPKAAGRDFVFSLNEHVLSFMLYRLAIAQLNEGLGAWDRLQPIKHELGAQNLVELMNNLKVMKMGHLLEREPVTPYKVVHNHRGQTFVGQHCHIKDTAFIDITGGVKIGNYVIISDDVHIHTHTHNMKKGTPINVQTDQEGVPASAVIIGDDVWLQSKSQVMPTVTNIPNGTVLMASAVLTKNPTREYGIYAGVPAVLVGERTEDGHVFFKKDAHGTKRRKKK